MKKSVMFLILSLVLFGGARMARAEKKASTQSHASSVQTNWNSFKPETLSGTISIVGSKNKDIFVTSSDGIPYHFVVNKQTKIEIGGASASFEKLADKTGSQVAITFVARPQGNFAKSITVSS